MWSQCECTGRRVLNANTALIALPVYVATDGLQSHNEACLSLTIIMRPTPGAVFEWRTGSAASGQPLRRVCRAVDDYLACMCHSGAGRSLH